MDSWTDFAEKQSQAQLAECSSAKDNPPLGFPTGAPEDQLLQIQLQRSPARQPSIGDHGWPIPSSLSANPEEARAGIQLPEFDALLLEKARVISGRFPFAEAEYRNLRGTGASAQELEIPHFERV